MANATKADGFDVVNLSLARQIDLHTDVTITVDDLFDASPAFWPGYPGRGRTIRGAVEYRF